MSTESIQDPTFEELFLGSSAPLRIRVPDYQRAFAWEAKQTSLFISDLATYERRPRDYYFGHFIIEALDGAWEIVDGQQRITTLVLFLMVCRHLYPTLDHPALALVEKFSTVSYDREALRSIEGNLGPLFEYCRSLPSKQRLADDKLISRCSLKPENFTHSQHRIASALRCFYEAFEPEGPLQTTRMTAYIDVVMKASCSHHPTHTKAVAVNVFEMHNTRGVPLTIIEVMKAKLMKHVYHYADENDREKKVGEIQAEFGEIYRLEEMLSKQSFRGDLTLKQLLHLHLTVIDDGTKKTAADFRFPPTNANADELISYLDQRLLYEDEERKIPRSREQGVIYALAVAKEFRRSVRLMSEFLPRWDQKDPLVGDAMILDPWLSCQFFLLVGRPIPPESGENFLQVDSVTLALWERLLFTRDFHGGYHNLRYKDDFPKLFAEIRSRETAPAAVILPYVEHGFRGHDATKNLQNLVATYLHGDRDKALNDAYNWGGRRNKVIYAIYKYEISQGANLRETMKGQISLEHILPLEWQWKWIETWESSEKEGSESEREAMLKEVGSYINGLGNLLLLTQSENAAQGNLHPADKKYGLCFAGGSYAEHSINPEKWRSSKAWRELIRQRGERIFNFMLKTLVAPSAAPQSSQTDIKIVPLLPDSLPGTPLNSLNQTAP